MHTGQNPSLLRRESQVAGKETFVGLGGGEETRFSSRNNIRVLDETGNLPLYSDKVKENVENFNGNVERELSITQVS